MEQVAKGSCESLLLVKWSKEGEGCPGPGSLGQKDTWGQGLLEHRRGRATAGGTTAPALVGSPHTEKNTNLCEQSWKYSSKTSYYKNTASSCFPWALTPNVLHLSSVVIKAQQSH